MPPPPQLVGLDCVLCRKRIESIVDGTFCGRCGCPVHNSCALAAVERAQEGACPICGAAPAAVEEEQARLRADNLHYETEARGARGMRLIIMGVPLMVGGIG